MRRTDTTRRSRQLFHGQRGQLLPMMGISLVVLVGFVGFAVDVANVLYVRRALQASTDAAAAAGAQALPDQNAAQSMAVAYGSQSGQKNVRSNVPSVSTSSTFRCVNSTGLPTCTLPTVNAIVVTQTSVVPMRFARVLGMTTMTVSTTATATMRGGSMIPLDVEIVLDTTGSMSGTPLSEAKEGIRSLLSTFWPCAQGISTCGVSDPVIDYVGLFVFPPLSNAAGNVAREYDCAGSPNLVIVPYSAASPVYEIIPFTNDYRTSTTASLNQNSNLVKAVDGRSGCPGLEAIGGQGSYFASPITQAQSKLQSSGRANIQNVIIFVSDGAANTYTGAPANPCQTAVTAAQSAKAAGTWIYSIRYYDTSEGAGSCANDSPSKTARLTMQQINSDYPQLTKFFEVPSGNDLKSTFQKIGQDLMTTRMVDDSTP